ncbi:hypothetical protein KIH75_06635, partial [Bifidobacterium sp. 64T4]|uniref:hypothetical protein n=1 Tax=Bifidobacterium pongonis TaxID=2834432 RepID=UPI001C59DAEB
RTNGRTAATWTCPGSMTTSWKRTDHRAMDGHDPKCATFRALPMFDDGNRALKTDDENFVALIGKINQYAKRIDITSEAIWRNPQEDGNATKFTVAYSLVRKLNDEISQLTKSQASNQ